MPNYVRPQYILHYTSHIETNILRKKGFMKLVYAPFKLGVMAQLTPFSWFILHLVQMA